MVHLSTYFTHRKVDEVPEHVRECWRTHTEGVGCRSRDTGQKKRMMCSHVSITSPLNLVCHLRDSKRHDDWWPAPHFVPIMVVARKAPLPPTPSSRSSSSQAIPRVVKVKANQLNQPEYSSPLANGKPKIADSLVSDCSYTYSAHRLWDGRRQHAMTILVSCLCNSIHSVSGVH